MEAYYEDPKKCEQCGSVIPHDRRRNKFCDHTCSATFTNRSRIEDGFVLSPDAKRRMGHGKGNGKIPSPEQLLRQKIARVGDIGADANFSKLYEIRCESCDVIRLVSGRKKHNKTCGKRECVSAIMIDTRPPGSTHLSSKRSVFFNSFTQENVLLDSSWEVRVAELLEERKIRWYRPDSLPWTDYAGIKHSYFPDFYLSDYDLYLDPKNPWVMVRDGEKMSIISEKVLIIYGDVSLIMGAINDL